MLVSASFFSPVKNAIQKTALQRVNFKQSGLELAIAFKQAIP